jgi:hypothetical protein
MMILMRSGSAQAGRAEAGVGFRGIDQALPFGGVFFDVMVVNSVVMARERHAIVIRSR